MHRALLLLILLLTLGCAVSTSTLTEAQALARVNQLIYDTAQALTPKPRLEPLSSYSAPSSCLKEGTPRGQMIISRAYWLRDIPKSDNLAISRQVRTYWQARGHRITASGKDGNPDLSGISKPDGFTLTLTWAEGDQLYLGAASTCVWPDGAPDPE